MLKKILYSFLFLICPLCLLSNLEIGFSQEPDNCFELRPWQVGQFVEYQIIGYDDHGRENRYRLSIIEKETIEDKDCFWIKLDIFSGQRREMSFKALVKPVTSADFAKEPDLYISEGLIFLLKNAQRLILILSDNSSYEASPDKFFNQPDILEGTFYKNVPDEKNKVDYSKLEISQQKEAISTPSGVFDCYQFLVRTNDWESDTDEGFNLWRSPEVPFLGIVKMEFSKTEHLKKWNYRYSNLLSNKDWLSRLGIKFFVRRVPRLEYKDTFFMKLVDYGS